MNMKLLVECYKLFVRGGVVTVNPSEYELVRFDFADPPSLVCIKGQLEDCVGGSLGLHHILRRLGVTQVRNSKKGVWRSVSDLVSGRSLDALVEACEKDLRGVESDIRSAKGAFRGILDNQRVLLLLKKKCSLEEQLRYLSFSKKTKASFDLGVKFSDFQCSFDRGYTALALHDTTQESLPERLPERLQERIQERMKSLVDDYNELATLTATIFEKVVKGKRYESLWKQYMSKKYKVMGGLVCCMDMLSHLHEPCVLSHLHEPCEQVPALTTL